MLFKRENRLHIRAFQPGAFLSGILPLVSGARVSRQTQEHGYILHIPQQCVRLLQEVRGGKGYLATLPCVKEETLPRAVTHFYRPKFILYFRRRAHFLVLQVIGAYTLLVLVRLSLQVPKQDFPCSMDGFNFVSSGSFAQTSKNHCLHGDVAAPPHVRSL